MRSTASPDRSLWVRNRYLLIADLMLVPAIAWLSFALRLDDHQFESYRLTVRVFVGAALAVQPVIFYAMGLYRRYWRYASVEELIRLAVTTFLGTGAVAFLSYGILPLLFEFRAVPRSIPFIHWSLSLLGIGGVRFAVRIIAERPSLWRTARGRRTPLERRVLVMGAGYTGAVVVREMQISPKLRMAPIGLVDDDPAKLGMLLHDVPVLGTREDIPRLVREKAIDEVIIAMPTAPGRAIREVVAICRKARVAFRTIPGIHELLSGRVSIQQVREVRIEDLLRRDAVSLDGTRAVDCLEGAVVLVTGAGGSIGRELSQHIATYRPQHLLLLGHGEHSIYLAMQEFERKFPHQPIRPLIADVRDEKRLSTIFARYKPDVVFHAAAHKHVPLMESNVAEAIENNVFGTRSLLRVCEVFGTQRFVLVSTDKAVDPTNVMGASKRLAELLVQDAARRTGLPYMVVRFGNVLGSRGSVVPLFQQQIAHGGPVTITHPDMRRYFMTIPEAAQLIIQAAALGQGGEIFVLDMGEPVLVLDLATELIRLSGLEPGRDIDIEFTGVRPGEKLDEVLFVEGEQPRPTAHDKILLAYENGTLDSETLSAHLGELERLVQQGDPVRLRAKIQEILPTYDPRHRIAIAGEMEPA